MPRAQTTRGRLQLMQPSTSSGDSRASTSATNQTARRPVGFDFQRQALELQSPSTRLEAWRSSWPDDLESLLVVPGLWKHFLLQCGLCNHAYFQTASNLQKHVSVNHAAWIGEEVRCPICEDRSSDAVALAQHFEAKHSRTRLTASRPAERSSGRSAPSTSDVRDLNKHQFRPAQARDEPSLSTLGELADAIDRIDEAAEEDDVSDGELMAVDCQARELVEAGERVLRGATGAQWRDWERDFDRRLLAISNGYAVTQASRDESLAFVAFGKARGATATAAVSEARRVAKERAPKAKSEKPQRRDERKRSGKEAAAVRSPPPATAPAAPVPASASVSQITLSTGNVALLTTALAPVSGYAGFMQSAPLRIDLPAMGAGEELEMEFFPTLASYFVQTWLDPAGPFSQAALHAALVTSGSEAVAETQVRWFAPFEDVRMVTGVGSEVLRIRPGTGDKQAFYQIALKGSVTGVLVRVRRLTGQAEGSWPGRGSEGRPVRVKTEGDDCVTICGQVSESLVTEGAGGSTPNSGVRQWSGAVRTVMGGAGWVELIALVTSVRTLVSLLSDFLRPEKRSVVLVAQTIDEMKRLKSKLDALAVEDSGWKERASEAANRTAHATTGNELRPLAWLATLADRAFVEADGAELWGADEDGEEPEPKTAADSPKPKKKKEKPAKTAVPSEADARQAAAEKNRAAARERLERNHLKAVARLPGTEAERWGMKRLRGDISRGVFADGLLALEAELAQPGERGWGASLCIAEWRRVSERSCAIWLLRELNPEGMVRTSLEAVADPKGAGYDAAKADAHNLMMHSLNGNIDASIDLPMFQELLDGSREAPLAPGRTGSESWMSIGLLRGQHEDGPQRELWAYDSAVATGVALGGSPGYTLIPTDLKITNNPDIEFGVGQIVRALEPVRGRIEEVPNPAYGAVNADPIRAINPGAAAATGLVPISAVHEGYRGQTIAVERGDEAGYRALALHLWYSCPPCELDWTGPLTAVELAAWDAAMGPLRRGRVPAAPPMRLVQGLSASIGGQWLDDRTSRRFVDPWGAGAFQGRGPNGNLRCAFLLGVGDAAELADEYTIVHVPPALIGACGRDAACAAVGLMFAPWPPVWLDLAYGTDTDCCVMTPGLMRVGIPGRKKLAFAITSQLNMPLPKSANDYSRYPLGEEWGFAAAGTLIRAPPMEYTADGQVHEYDLVAYLTVNLIRNPDAVMRGCRMIAAANRTSWEDVKWAAAAATIVRRPRVVARAPGAGLDAKQREPHWSTWLGCYPSGQFADPDVDYAGVDPTGCILRCEPEAWNAMVVTGTLFQDVGGPFPQGVVDQVWDLEGRSTALIASASVMHDGLGWSGLYLQRYMPGWCERSLEGNAEIRSIVATAVRKLFSTCNAPVSDALEAMLLAAPVWSGLWLRESVSPKPWPRILCSWSAIRLCLELHPGVVGDTKRQFESLLAPRQYDVAASALASATARGARAIVDDGAEYLKERAGPGYASKEQALLWRALRLTSAAGQWGVRPRRATDARAGLAETDRYQIDYPGVSVGPGWPATAPPADQEWNDPLWDASPTLQTPILWADGEYAAAVRSVDGRGAYALDRVFPQPSPSSVGTLAVRPLSLTARFKLGLKAVSPAGSGGPPPSASGGSAPALSGPGAQ